MPTTLTVDEYENVQLQAPKIPHPETSPAVDQGLRSARGIRWLHWIGALVVGVSVVGLLAARWGELPPAVQFLVLVGGAVILQAAGEVARVRLRLPATSSALFFLFTALVPLLAWGAAYLDLARDGFGLLSLVLGLGGLLWSVRRVLARVLEYRGAIYPVSLGLLLFAMPALVRFDGVGLDTKNFFLVAAISLGLVMRFASRHIHRFFFHRDRVAGEDRPIHFLPFALLALVYLAGMSLLSAATISLAVPLLFLAIVLIDTGEEYFQALVRVSSKVPERWPTRSVGLLAAGFGLMAVAVAVAPIDNTFRAMALVTIFASLRLFAWALRYQHKSAYAFAVGSALVAYHFSPMLVPNAVKHLFWRLVEALGIHSGSSAVVSLADLGALTGLVVLGAVLKRRGKLTLAMERLHVAFLSFQGLVVLATALPDPSAARTLMPLAVVVLLAGLALLRRSELVPIFYLALAHACVVWFAPVSTMAELLLPEVFAVLVGFNLAWTGAILLTRIPRVRERFSFVHGLRNAGLAGADAWYVGPAVAGSIVTLAAAATWVSWLGFAGFLFITSGVTLLLAGLTQDPKGSSINSVFARWSRQEMAWWGVVFSVVLIYPGAGAFFLALALAALELTRVFQRASSADLAADSPRAFDLEIAGWRLQGLIALALIQTMAAGWMVFASAAWLLITVAIAQRVLAEALERRGHGIVAAATYPTSWALAALAAVMSVVHTLGVSGSPWLPIMPGFLASLFFAFLAREGYARIFSAIASMAVFAVSLVTLFDHLSYLGNELYWLAPGLALIGLSRLLEREIGRGWSERIFTVGATCLYAMPVLGLFEEITWHWQIVLLLLAIGFGAASFRLRSRSLLTLSTAAVVIDLGFFLLKLGLTAPLLLWAVGIFFGLSLMGCATLLEYRREILLQKIRVWGQEIRSWA